MTYNGSNLKVLDYVDDITCIVSNKHEVINIFRIVESFSEEGKTWKSFFYKNLQNRWKILILGIKWTPHIKETVQINEQIIIDKVVNGKKFQYSFKHLISRTIFINVYIISKCIYIFQLFPMTKQTIVEINKYFDYFNWKIYN